MNSSYKHRVILILILAGILLYGFLSEKIPANDGFGFDGKFYGDFTLHFKDHITNHSINKYHFQRIGLPFIIYHAFVFLNISLTAPNVILAYCICNALLITLSVYVFFLISNLLKLSKNTEIIGFSSLFFCFPILKLCMYYPVLMDIPAFAISLLLLYFYLRRNMAVFLLLVFAGSFIYPNFITLSVLLFFKPIAITSNTETAGKGWLSYVKKINPLWLLFCFLLPVFLCVIYITLFWRNSWELISGEFALNPGNTCYIWAAFLGALVYLTYLSYHSPSAFSLRKVIGSLSLAGIVGSIVVFVAPLLIVNYFASKDANTFTHRDYLYNVIFQAVKNPFNFIVAHLFYYGPVVLLSLLVIKDIKKVMLQNGYGMLLFVNMALFFSVGSESRQLITYYPFLVFLLLAALNQYKQVSFAFSVIFALICIGLSHFWYKINKGIDASTVFDYFLNFDFPQQRYFMFQGPWVNDKMYLIHLIVFTILLILFWILVKRTTLVTIKPEKEPLNNK